LRISDDNLRGQVVLSADGIAIGEVHKLFFHGAQFTIDAVEVKLRKEIAERLDIKHSTFHPATLEIPAGFVQSVGDAVILSAKLDELRMVHTSSETVETHDPQPVDVH
jgi:sporulation protein YlmC with PRC-barrel domain